MGLSFSDILRAINKGDAGSVRGLQERLIHEGYFCGRFGADNCFGGDTKSALLQALGAISGGDASEAAALAEKVRAINTDHVRLSNYFEQNAALARVGSEYAGAHRAPPILPSAPSPLPGSGLRGATVPPEPAASAPSVPTFPVPPSGSNEPIISTNGVQIPSTGDPLRDAMVRQAYAFLGAQETVNPVTGEENEGPLVRTLATYGQNNFGAQRRWPTQDLPYCTLFTSAMGAMLDKAAGNKKLTFPYEADSHMSVARYRDLQRPGKPQIVHDMHGNSSDYLPASGDWIALSYNYQRGEEGYDGQAHGHQGVVVDATRDRQGNMILSVISANVTTTAGDPARKEVSDQPDGVYFDKYMIRPGGQVVCLTGEEDTPHITMSVVDITAVPGADDLRRKLAQRPVAPVQPDFPVDRQVTAQQQSLVAEAWRDGGGQWAWRHQRDNGTPTTTAAARRPAGAPATL